jgi:hypothetical protein
MLLWGAAGAGALACALLVLMRPDNRDQPPSPGATSTEQGGLARELAEQIKVVFDDPTVAIHLQRAHETGVYTDRLTNDDLPLHEGDKVQVHVSLDRPQYVYLYWYDAAGAIKRLWPLDVARLNEPKSSCPTRTMTTNGMLDPCRATKWSCWRSATGKWMATLTHFDLQSASHR